ncbi:MAG: hypothetical protein SEPTF4163_001878 [Sporothrix epigloea]
MTNAQVYSTFKSCVLRLHDALNMRRNKKTKPQLVISAPFDFKKEDSMSILPGTFGEELFMLREKAAASIVGSALNSPYEAYSDSVTLTPSSVLVVLGMLITDGPPYDDGPANADIVGA